MRRLDARYKMLDPESKTCAAIGGIQHPASGAGSALIVALWVILILSLLIGSFAFNMHIEAGIASYYRKRLKAEYASLAGIELAKMVLNKSQEAEEGGPDTADDEDGLYTQAYERMAKGAEVNLTEQIGAASVEVTVFPAESRRNVNTLVEEDWEDIFEGSGVPEDLWDELIAAFYDWTDENDLHRVNGAESDDPYYKDREYLVKNGPLDTVDELTLIKGFTKAIVYGGVYEEDDDLYLAGIAPIMTAWGDGKINPNSADRRTLESLGLLEWQIDAIIEYRTPDSRAGNFVADDEDTFFESIDEVMDVGGLPDDLRDQFVISETKFFRVISVGSVGPTGRQVRRYVSCVLRLDEDGVSPVYWQEEQVQ